MASRLSQQEKCLSSKSQVYNLVSQLIIGGFKEWKIKAFKAVGDLLDKTTITNIVALGDSQIELDAATILGEYLY
jgi:hypothetical protein